ncbi:hypothetical protein [Nocardioides luteus]|uniref:hypothetical protein n=1 Tax=Nocardioides luteus TaxID=1844 RepID=UPI0018C9735B|nr:hypothetical protein [Nocardioides luteus]MBG6098776.1 hypothetical protein [Nocardioides luteus]
MSSATYAPVNPGPDRLRKGGRVFLAVLLGLLGGPLVLLGTGLAIAAGPDDVVMGKETPIEQGAAYSTPEAFAFDRLPVTVRVEAMGETYIGVGNPVDVLDVVEDTKAVEIARTPLTRVSGTAGSGDEVPDASQAPWWHETVSGSGTQELNVTLEGEPVSFLAASRDGAPIKLAFGYRLDGIFAASLGVAGGGALLLVGAVVLLLTGRRERPEEWQPPRPPASYVQPTHPIHPAQPTRPAQPARPGLTGPAPARPAPPRPPAGGLYRRLGVAAGVGVLTLSLTGCSMPAAVELEPVSKVSLRKDEVADLMKDWNKRNNRAIKANQPGKWKAEAWTEADSGPVLAKDQLTSAANKSFDVRDRPPTWRAVPGRVWSVQLSEYPMWAVIEVNVKGDRKRKLTRLAVYEQQDALSPWKVRSSLGVKKKAVPSEVEGAAPASASVTKQVEEVAATIDAYLEKPTRIDGLDGFKKLADPGEEIAAYASDMGVDLVRTTAEPFDASSTRIVQTPEGALAMLDFTTDSIVGGQDSEWEWNPPYDEFRSRAGKNLSIRTAVTVAVLVPQDGDPSVLGVEYGEIMGAKVKN